MEIDERERGAPGERERKSIERLSCEGDIEKGGKVRKGGNIRYIEIFYVSTISP